MIPLPVGKHHYNWNEDPGNNPGLPKKSSKLGPKEAMRKGTFLKIKKHITCLCIHLIMLNYKKLIMAASLDCDGSS